MRAFPRNLPGVIALTIFLAVAASGQTRFIQLTDPHIFDADQPAQNEILNNKQKQKRLKDAAKAFGSAIEAINKQIDAGARYEFIAITGDMGMAHWSSSLEEAAEKMAGWIEKSKVKRFFFVPGNNDVGDSFERVDRYKGFIAALIKLLPERVVEICETPVLEKDGTLYIGFDTATYKERLPKHLAELEALRERLKSYDAKRIYLFIHIAEIDDPYRMEINQPKPDRKDYPFSPWGVDKKVRDMWHELMADSSVKAVFTGHFHSNGRRYYQKPFDWVRSPYPKDVIEKTFLCPPISCKYQWDRNPRARGFQIITIDQEGKASAQIFWYEQGKFIGTPARRQSDAVRTRNIDIFAPAYRPLATRL